MTIIQTMRREGVTAVQLTALRALAVYGEMLRHAPNGWETAGGCRISGNTIGALSQKGLCTLDNLGDACPTVWITDAGREVLARIDGAAS